MVSEPSDIEGPDENSFESAGVDNELEDEDRESLANEDEAIVEDDNDKGAEVEDDEAISEDQNPDENENEPDNESGEEVASENSSLSCDSENSPLATERVWWDIDMDDDILFDPADDLQIADFTELQTDYVITGEFSIVGEMPILSSKKPPRLSMLHPAYV
jgi:hypothetical protein